MGKKVFVGENLVGAQAIYINYTPYTKKRVMMKKIK